LVNLGQNQGPKSTLSWDMCLVSRLYK
jgi:hypothetical protein